MESHLPNNHMPANRMIKADESAKVFLFAVFANLAVQFLGSFFLLEYAAATETEISVMGELIFMMFIQAVYLGVYFRFVPGKNRFLRWPIQNKMIQRRSLGNRIVLILLSVTLGFLSLAAFLLPTVWFDTLLSMTGYEGVGIEFSGIADMIFGAVIIVLIAPIVEELIFRGALLSGLSRSHGVLKAVLMTAFAFMLSHMNPSQTLYQFLLGAVCGFAVAYTRTLVAGIVVHASSNLAALLLDFTPLGTLLDTLLTEISKNPVLAVSVTAGSVVVFGGLLFLILYYFKKIAPKETDLPPLKEQLYRPIVFLPPDPFAQSAVDPFAIGATAPILLPTEPEVDQGLTDAVHAARKASARILYWVGCFVCAGMWMLILFSGMFMA